MQTNEAISRLHILLDNRSHIYEYFTVAKDDHALRRSASNPLAGTQTEARASMSSLCRKASYLRCLSTCKSHLYQCFMINFAIRLQHCTAQMSAITPFSPFISLLRSNGHGILEDPL